VHQVLRPFVIVLLAISLWLCPTRRAAADPIGVGWPQPGGPGSDVFITYSYSNFFDRSFLFLSPAELRAGTEEALGLWARYAPLHFIEKPDSGPHPSDVPYPADEHPQIRIGHHATSELAHAFFPDVLNGLAGDIHFDARIPWTMDTGRFNFLEAVTHEVGHALGLGHETERMAIMNPLYPQQRFNRLGSAFLLPPDIENLQAMYGAGSGSVQPIPEPGALALVVTGLCGLARALRSRG
jgi:hypothetical protein